MAPRTAVSSPKSNVFSSRKVICIFAGHGIEVILPIFDRTNLAQADFFFSTAVAENDPCATPTTFTPCLGVR